MQEYIETLELEFAKNAHAAIAKGQRVYMKNHFEFYGIKSPLRRQIQRPFLQRDYLPSKEDLEKIVQILWKKPQREYQYFAQELTAKYTKQLDKKDIELFEYMIRHKSWWDTIDFIAPKLVGTYFMQYPEQRNHIIEKWLASGNIWLQRSAILFQLNYKNELDTDFLTHIIHSLLGSDVFFINKAIGWILRQYSRTNPQWVIDFANRTPLHKLSYKEALRLIK